MNKYCEKCNKTRKWTSKFCNDCGSELIMEKPKQLTIDEALQGLMDLVDLTNKKILLIDKRLCAIESKKPKKEKRKYRRWNQKADEEWTEKFKIGFEEIKKGEFLTNAMAKAKIWFGKKNQFMQYCKDNGIEVKTLTPEERGKYIRGKRTERKRQHEKPMIRDKPFQQHSNIGGIVLPNTEEKHELPQIKNVLSFENLEVCVRELLRSPATTEITFKEHGCLLGINNFEDWGEFCISFMTNANKIARYFKVTNEFRFDWSHAKISYG